MSSAASRSPEGDETTQRGTEDIFADVSGDVVIVSPTPTLIRTFVERQGGLDDLDTVRIIASEEVLKEVRLDFLLASQIMDLIDEGDLGVRMVDDVTPETPLLVTEDQVTALIETPATSITMENDDEDLASAAFDSYGDLWDGSGSFSFRTPPLNALRSSFKAEFGEEAEKDLYEIVKILSEDEEYDSTKLNESVATLVVAGKHEILLYDVGRWGEDVGLASKATFSRSKTQLEDRGVLETEKVPIDVGRPRLRLELSSNLVSKMTDDGDVSDLTTEDLAEIVKDNS